jgi:hypothetical protein
LQESKIIKIAKADVGFTGTYNTEPRLTTVPE